eukprot:TRINITY_DN4101_c4_g1_i1.p1 TRINITY_DN4101_c4_g1~~TRINITY_DN4101_c4_g1_i1.p1  ORF type:complete len:209 (+),score=48.41 TRINITY_DN4101_c4_g1_i1:56-682(+)
MTYQPKTIGKVIVLGDSAVGKTSLLSRFVSGKFDSRFKASVGADFLIKEDIQIGDKMKMSLQLWDTAGQERFANALGTAYYRGADACVLVFDLTDGTSFSHISSWLEEFTFQVQKERPFILIGNKNDLEDKRVISQKNALAWCAAHGNIPYFETSARDNFNVDRAFHELATIIANNILEERQLPDIPIGVDLNKKAKKPKYRGCGKCL